MKNFLIIWLLMQNVFCTQAQQVKPCDKWENAFIQVEPKVSDGTGLDKYVLEKLRGDTTLKGKASCMVGLRIYVNCQGEFSYEKEAYPNDSRLAAQCNDLQQKVNHILRGIKSFLPGTTEGKKKDFILKLVVWVKHSGEPGAEVLY